MWTAMQQLFICMQYMWTAMQQLFFFNAVYVDSSSTAFYAVVAVLR